MRKWFSMKWQVAVWLLLSVVLVSSSKRPVTVFIIGDSTAAEKVDPKGSPERGWGMVLQGFFSEKVKVENHAVNGRSSKSFRDEGRWQKVIDRVHPGDYVIIQFGHNDEKPSPERHTDVGSTFDDNLRRYVRETREKGGVPVLMSCVARRNFYREDAGNDDDELLRTTGYGKQEHINSDTLIDTHGDYRLVPARIAREMNVIYVDANRITTDIENRLGPDGSRKLHMWLKPGEWAKIPDGRSDNTHYNIYGARIVAGALADALGKEVKWLGKQVRHYDYVVSAEGRGNFMTLQDAAGQAPVGLKTTIYVLDGTWKKPHYYLGKKLRIKCFPGASIGH